MQIKWFFFYVTFWLRFDRTFCLIYVVLIRDKIKERENPKSIVSVLILILGYFQQERFYTELDTKKDRFFFFIKNVRDFSTTVISDWGKNTRMETMWENGCLNLSSACLVSCHPIFIQNKTPSKVGCFLSSVVCTVWCWWYC